ncbi:MAG: exo-alpha-sialidase, partial [Candidatus Dormibacteraeota bacterium]|nr:exo-alpha-sialidase [Candidatus Dormibacteraeota bacterium]
KTFASVWPVSLPEAMGAITVGPDGTVWAGTGETNPGGGSITFFGDGIYRSTDGGSTWSNVGLTDSWTIARIVVNPANANQVWVAVSGNLFLPGHQRGVYVTNNGLTSNPSSVVWTQSLAPPLGSNGTGTLSATGASDLAMSQQHPNVLYAAMWDHIRTPDHRTYTGSGSGVWKTTDGGTTWTELTSAANAVTSGLLADNTANGRIGVAVAPSDDHYVYVNYANDPLGAFEAWFTSTDGGATFSKPAQAQLDLRIPVTNSSYVYGWWFAKTFVDPKTPTNVWVTGLCLWSSTDGGSTFPNDDCSVHADQHSMEWDPNVANQVYLGDDGGFFTSTHNGTPGTFVPATYEPWPQFDGLDVSEQDPTHIAGGLQDNGSQRSWDSNGNAVAMNGWNSMYGGDGQQNLIDPQNNKIVYSCLQYGNCQVSTDGGNTGTEFDNGPTSLNPDPNGTVSARNAYFTPMAFDPSNPDTVYWSGDIVNVSNNDGANWRVISPDLGGPIPGTEADPLYAGHYGVVTTISVSKSNHDIVWVGTDSGNVWMTSDATSNPTMPTWTQISGLGVTNSPLPTRWVSKVYVDPDNPQIVYVGFSGYRAGDNNPYIERTDDGGATWTDLSSGLPEATVNDITLAGGRLWVATDTGIYASDAAQDPTMSPSITWREIGDNLPAIAVTALRYVQSNTTLYISTFGRGVWSLALAPATSTPEAGAALLLPLGGALAAGGAVLLRRRRARRRAAMQQAKGGQ